MNLSGIVGQISVVSVFHETKHQNCPKDSGKFRNTLHRILFLHARFSFCTFLALESGNLSQSLDFLTELAPGPPQSRKFFRASLRTLFLAVDTQTAILVSTAKAPISEHRMPKPTLCVYSAVWGFSVRGEMSPDAHVSLTLCLGFDLS